MSALTATAPVNVGPFRPAYYPDVLKVGSVNRKAVVFAGLSNDDNGVIRSLLPLGTFLIKGGNGTIDTGAMTQTAHGFDISKEFDFSTFVSVPHTLWGLQTDNRYDPNYALANPSGDHTTFVCDAKNFMTAKTDNPFLAADFKALFTDTPPSPAVRVYVGTPGSPATGFVSPSTYTWNASTGTVTFTSAQASNAIVSIDGVPQSMAPEVMLRHLFVDNGHYDPSFLNLQTSNIQVPMYIAGSGQKIWQIAQYVAAMTAPRGVRWELRMDEFGVVQFYENRTQATPTETLVDEADFLTFQLSVSDDQLANIVRADCYANNQQPIASISYDVDSINDKGQRDTQDIDTTPLLACRGLPSLTVKSYADTLTAVQLYEASQNIVEVTADVVPNPARQVGDKVTVMERKYGFSGPYIIKGIQNTIQDGGWQQQLRLRQMLLSANYNMGLPSAIVNAIPWDGSTIPQNVTVVGKTGFIKTVSIGGTTAIQNGAIVKDASGNAVIPQILANGGTFGFSFTLETAQAYDSLVWQFMYLEAANSLSSTDAMVVRLPSWVSSDKNVVTAATVASGYTRTSSRTAGSALGATETAYLYSNLVYPATSFSLPSSYNQEITALSFIANTNLSGSVGVGLGPAYTGSYAYYPHQKYNYGWYVLVGFNAAGAVAFQRIPFLFVC